MSALGNVKLAARTASVSSRLSSPLLTKETTLFILPIKAVSELQASFTLFFIFISRDHFLYLIMATHVGALSHLVEAASALADMQPALLPHAGATAGRSSKNDSKSTAADSKREIFPERLLAILNDASLSEVVTWLPHGRSFVIIRPDVFAETVMPQYFPSADARTSSKYPSFTRKLNRW
jgi:hypothetical protein